MRTVSLNGANFSVPEPGDTAYDQALSNYLVALATAFPQISNAATQALGAELDLGALFGIKALYLKTQTANPAATGQVRLAKTDSLSFRNNANTADLALTISGSDQLQFAGSTFISAPLAAEQDFGASFGIKSLYYKSRAAIIAASGAIRLAGGAAADSISFRNNANTADLPLTVNTGDQLLFNGLVVQTGAQSGTPNPLVAPTAAQLGLEGNKADSATTIGVQIGNAFSLVTAGAKIASFYSDALTTEKVYIDKDGNIVHSAGSGTHSTTAANAQVQIKGNRNAADVGADVVLNTTATRTAGNLISIQNAGTEKARFDPNGILTASDTAWSALTLAAGVTNVGAPNFNAAVFKDAFGFVNLRGRVTTTNVNPSVLFTLPLGYRPSATLQVIYYTNGGSVGWATIDSTGAFTQQGGNLTNISIDNITFDTR